MRVGFAIPLFSVLAAARHPGRDGWLAVGPHVSDSLATAWHVSIFTVGFDVPSIGTKSRLVQCISFVIAHRLSTIREADKVVVMSLGRIVEVGTNDELKDRGADELGQLPVIGVRIDKPKRCALCLFLMNSCRMRLR